MAGSEASVVEFFSGGRFCVEDIDIKVLGCVCVLAIDRALAEAGLQPLKHSLMFPRECCR